MRGCSRLLDQRLHRQATRERRRTANLRVLPVDGPAAPDELVSVADRDLLDRGFRRLRAGPARDPRPAPLPRVCPVGDRRDPRHPARHGPIPTAQRPPRHAGRPRGGRARRRGRRSHGMNDDRDLEPPPRRLVRRRIRPGRRPRVDDTATGSRASASARVAPPSWRDPTMNTYAQASWRSAARARPSSSAASPSSLGRGGLGRRSSPSPTPSPTPIPSPIALMRRLRRGPGSLGAGSDHVADDPL